MIEELIYITSEVLLFHRCLWNDDHLLLNVCVYIDNWERIHLGKLM